MGEVAAHSVGEAKAGGMNGFADFARAHGLIVEHIVPGKWVRVPTQQHPRKRNGAYKFCHTHGFVQEHSTMTEPAVWRPDVAPQIDMAAIQKQAKEAACKVAEGRREAARTARLILERCTLQRHPYLERKGFHDECGMVADDKLVIPMYVGSDLVGAQTITGDGQKKFLFGQRTGGAAFVLNARGPHVLCEGYATALSVRAALAALKRRYTLHVCFSAHNLTAIARTLPGGFVVADNDRSGTGEQAAKATGWPYFMPPEVGQDFNDFHLATSTFRVAQALRAAMT